ncbi:MAG: TetR/AcrR family transcriptional regulator [Anaerolineae bacterium]|nr:TetR/AcrR family transcriptional regulator [Anaerolineae bacterium]
MTETSHPYHQHRASQREHILRTAEALFIRGGIDGVSMSEIARAAGITRKTLYAYFANRQELAWAILQDIFEQSRAGDEVPASGTALDQLEQHMLRIIHHAQTHPEHARFIVEFDSLYAREVNADRMRQVTGRAQSAETGFSRLVRQGIADGSLDPGLDPELASAVIWNLLSGMNSRFALLGELIPLEYDRPVPDIYHEICRCFLRGLQNTTPVNSKENTDAKTML